MISEETHRETLHAAQLQLKAVQLQLQQEIRLRERQATLQAEVGIALAQGQSLRPMLQACAEAVMRHLDAAFARIWTIDELGTTLELQASAGMYTHLHGAHGRVPVGKFKIGLIAQERLAHLTNQVATDPRVSDKEWAKREGMVAFAGYPLIAQERLVGVIAMFARSPLENNTLEVLASIANTVAVAIERSRVEEERQKLVQAVENSSDFIGIAALDGSVIFLNEAGQKLVGLDGVKAARHTRMIEYLMEEDRPYVEQHILPQIFGPEGRWVGEFRFRNFKTGEPIWVWWNLFTIREAISRKPIAIATASRDLTAQKMADVERTELLKREQVARAVAEKSEQQLRTLIDCIPTLAWTAREDGFIDFYNRRWYEYTGTTAEQMQGWGWKTVHDPALIDSVIEQWQKSLATGEPFEMEFPLRGADGVFRWFLTRVQPLYGPKGEIVRWFGTNTNIDDQREAHRQTEALLKAVAQQAREMEAALQSMRVAKEAAEERATKLQHQLLPFP